VINGHGVGDILLEDLVLTATFTLWTLFLRLVKASSSRIELPVIIVEDTKIQRIFGLAVDNLLIIW
jgi:hypothetical protein